MRSKMREGCPSPHPWPPVAGRTGPRVMRVEELVLPLTGCSMTKWALTLPVQHSRTDPFSG